MIRDKYPEDFIINIFMRFFNNGNILLKEINLAPKVKNHLIIGGLDLYTYVNNIVDIQIDINNDNIKIFNDHSNNTYNIKELDDDPELYVYIVPYIYEMYQYIFNKAKHVSNDFEEFLCALYIEYTINKNLSINFIECYGEKILEYIYNKY